MPAASATLTIKFTPRAKGADVGRWYLWIRRPHPQQDELIPATAFTRRDERDAVEAFAAPYRKALGKALAEPKPETADDFYDRFVKSRMGKVTTADTDHRQWLKWISPVTLGNGKTFGATAMVDVTPDDVEAVRDHLNVQVDAWEAAGKTRGTGMAYATAANVWSILTTAMKHASTRKGLKDLRVREAQGNPCLNIPPPRRGEAKRRHWCRSSWLNAALASPLNTDRAMNEAFVIGIGLHLRPQELHEVRVRDLDLEAGEVRIHRSHDERTKRIKGGTKTDTGTRTVSIPTWLAPVLARIAKERGRTDRLAPWVAATSEHDRAHAFRQWLKNGGAPEYLFEDTETHEQIDFRTVRDTGITLRFLAGERAEQIQREAGHKHPATTLSYAKEVSNKGDRYGAAFLTLPRELVGDAIAPAASGEISTAPAENNGGGASSHCAVTCEACEPTVKCERFPAESLGKSVARVGFESSQTAIFRALRERLAPTELTRVSGTARSQVATGPGDPLVHSLGLAAAAGRFDVVTDLAKELEARRLASAWNVVPIGRAKR